MFQSMAKYAKAPSGQVLIPRTEGLAIGTNILTGTPAMCFDGNYDKSRTDPAIVHSGNNDNEMYVGKDWGSGVQRTLTGFSLTGANGHGFIETGNPSVTLQLRGRNTSDPIGSTLIGSITLTDPGDGTTVYVLTGITPGLYRYHWARINASGGNERYMAQIEFYEG